MRVRSAAPVFSPPARRGASVVEFAILAPLLFTLFLGMIDVGRAIMASEMIASAAREGARRGIVTGADNTVIEAAVDNSLTNAGISTAQRTVRVRVNNTEVDAITAVPGNVIEITVGVPYRNVSWLPVTVFVGDRSLLVTCVMRHE